MSEKEKILTESQVWDVLDFSRALASTYAGYTPYGLNQRMKGLAGKKQFPTYDEITETLQNSGENVERLNGFVRAMEQVDSHMHRAIAYLSSMLSFDLAYVATNASGSDFKSKEYKADEARVNKFLFNFDYKRYFNAVVKNLLTSGKYFCFMRETAKKRSQDQKYALQMLPQDYCTITGDSNLSPLFDVDLSFLLKGDEDLECYADIFGKYYDRIFDKNSLNNYIPSNPLGSRDGAFSYTVQTSPYDGAWCFLYDTSNYDGLSPMAFFLRPSILGGEIEKLQYSKDVASAYTILSGEIPMAKDVRQQDNFKISPKVLADFLVKAQAGLDGILKLAALPLENQKFHTVTDTNPNMNTTQIQDNATLGISASRLLYATGHISEAEVVAMIQNDANPLIKLYSQFEQFLNFFVNQKTKKYKFAFSFKGLEYFFDKEERRENIITMADRGIILDAPFFAQACGIPPHVFKQALDAGKNTNFTEQLGSLLSIHTQGGDGSLNEKGGRPKKKRREGGDY